MANKASHNFKDRGNNGWGDKKHRTKKVELLFKVVAILDLEAGGKLRFERVPV